MEWQYIVAVVIAIPFVLIPVAFVWYLNVSGVYQVIRDSQRRQKRVAKVAREAQELVGNK